MSYELKDAKTVADLTGIDLEVVELQITAQMLLQRDRFELAYAVESGCTVESLAAWRRDTPKGFDYREDAWYMRGMWHGWKLRERLSGNDPFVGFMLEAANEGELAAYDYGCRSCEDAVRRITEGGDKGAGSTNEPWNTLRKRLLDMKADADRWQKLLRQSFAKPAFSVMVVSIPAVTKEEADQKMNEWMDGQPQ